MGDIKIKELATDFIKLNGGYQRRKHLFLKKDTISVDFIENTFGKNIFKILGVRAIKIPGGGYNKTPKLTYEIDGDGNIIKIASKGMNVKNIYNDNKLVETETFISLSQLNNIGRKNYQLNGYHVVKSKHYCNSVKKYFYDKNNNLRRIKTFPHKYLSVDVDYIDEWVYDGEIIRTVNVGNNKLFYLYSDIIYFLMNKLVRTKFYKMWKHCRKTKSTDIERKDFTLI